MASGDIDRFGRFFGALSQEKKNGNIVLRGGPGGYTVKTPEGARYPLQLPEKIPKRTTLPFEPDEAWP